ncbi:MAG: ribosome biogenesis GTP-binding protein YihA/YsxC [Campylobacteraceae bacterium]|nr:ribosome biogenesis GTP-binding protein YihA/YsxC [Campylobacteraceae bacterium]
MVKIIKAEFLKSATSIDNSIDEGVLEVVFLGRSNVGKSSLINALTNKKQLAKSSSTPGKTQLINFFDIVYEDESKSRFFARFVDLPGFGYAKVSKTKKHEWQKELDNFIKKRVSIRVFVHLIDSRHINLDIDNEVSNFLEETRRDDQAILNFYTKSDKLNQKDLHQILAKNRDAILVSTLKKQGLNEANKMIFNLLFGKDNDNL